MTSQELGALGEYHVWRLLESIGLDVEHGGSADLLIHGGGDK